MSKHSNMYEISLSKLNKTSRKRLITAKKYTDRYVKKHCDIQFSDDMIKNKELLQLLYSSPVHNTRLSVILELGLEYYSALLLAAQLPVPFYWQHRSQSYRICYQGKNASGNINPLVIKSWIEKAYSLDAGLSRYRNQYKRSVIHQEAIFRYQNLNKGEKPLWICPKLHYQYPFKDDRITKELNVLMKTEPDLTLMDYIKNDTFLYGNQSSAFLDLVVLYLNCEPRTKIGTLQSEDVFNALWQFYDYE